jgi:hypothetical protein
VTDDALDLIERAWNARTPRTRQKHARAALAIDPDALDAYVLIGQSLTDPAERLATYREGAARGRRHWAREMKAPARYGFWSDGDSRPFMRLLHLLALELWDAGAHSAAIAEAKTLLRLNRNDNQGIRELLHAWYPVTGEWDALDALLKRYREDWTTSHLYTAWLAAHRRDDATAASLEEALDANPHVPLLLRDPAAAIAEEAEDLGLPSGYVTMGSPAEARAYAEAALPGWRMVPGAIETLARDAAMVAAR